MSLKRFLVMLAAVTAAGVAMPRHAAAQSHEIVFISRMGSKCLDAEGGQTRAGTRIIGYSCSGDWNQRFTWNGNGPIHFGSNCLDASGGLGRDGDQVVVWQCNGQANQHWQLVNGEIHGINGKCLDLSGGYGHWFGNQPAIIYSCNHQDNQRWSIGAVVPASRVQGARVINPNQQVRITDISNVGAQVIAAGGGNVIAAGGGNVIAAGGGNVIAAGGGNVIAAGGGN